MIGTDILNDKNGSSRSEYRPAWSDILGGVLNPGGDSGHTSFDVFSEFFDEFKSNGPVLSKDVRIRRDAYFFGC